MLPEDEEHLGIDRDSASAEASPGAGARAHLLVQRVAAGILALLGVFPLANVLGDGSEVVWWRGAMIVWAAYGGMLILVLWVVADRWGGPVDRVMARIADHGSRISRPTFVATASLFTVAAAAFVALFSFSGQAFTGDEMVMSWHARMLLAGHVSIPRPAHSEFFSIFGVMDSGPRWFSQFPILGPALHAVGLAAHALWLVNPLLLGLATWQLYRFVRRTHGEHTARWATALFALSPFILILGATQLSHTPALLLTLLALAELAAWELDGPSSRNGHAALLGVAVGSIALVRPYDAALVATPIAVFQLVAAWRSPERWRSIAVQCAAGLVPVAVVFWANVHTTGRPLQFAYDAAHGAAHNIGFHVDPMGKTHTPLRGLIFTSGYLLRFNRFLFEWPIPAMALICVVLATVKRATRWDTLLLALLASFLCGYAAYWYPGFFDGPRFLFPVAPVLLIIVARWPDAAVRLGGTKRRVAMLLVTACLLCAWLIPTTFSSVPGRLTALRSQRPKLKLDVAAEVRRAGISNALVFIPESWHERLSARLRAIGMRFFDAERIVNSRDGCVLETELDASDGRTIVDTTALRNEILMRASAAGRTTTMPDRLPEARIERVAGGLDTPRCRGEAARDFDSLMPYGLFLREQRIDPDGQLGGDVVFARDFGQRNTLLSAQFGTRRWYRYHPGRSLEDPGVFEPLSR